MSKRRYKFKVTNLDALAKAYPKAVKDVVIPEKIIPASTERRADYPIIAKLLDCNLPVPGIELIDQDAEEQVQ